VHLLAPARSALAAAVGAAVLVAGAAAARPNDAQQRQLCVDRWNALNMRWGRANTVAVVRAAPCRVTLAYAYAGGVDRKNNFACVLNRFGAYACPGHAQGPGHDVGGWNATLRGYVLRLTDAPVHRVPSSPPPWLKRYEVTNGYLIPFDRRGARVAGIRVVAAVTGNCLPQIGKATFRSSLRCFGDDSFIRDPCFTATGRVRPGDFVLCPRAPGSTAFDRLRVDSLA
jgi:hypothetical protein